MFDDFCDSPNVCNKDSSEDDRSESEKKSECFTSPEDRVLGLLFHKLFPLAWTLKASEENNTQAPKLEKFLQN